VRTMSPKHSVVPDIPCSERSMIISDLDILDAAKESGRFAAPLGNRRGAPTALLR